MPILGSLCLCHKYKVESQAVKKKNGTESILHIQSRKIETVPVVRSRKTHYDTLSASANPPSRASSVQAFSRWHI